MKATRPITTGNKMTANTELREHLLYLLPTLKKYKNLRKLEELNGHTIIDATQFACN